MYALVVLAVSILPAIAFLSYILYMDRREPEPLGYVLRIVGLGSLSCLVAIVVELILDVFPIFHGESLVTAILTSFIQVAPVEELCKLGVVLLFVWNNPSFNEENDGIVYVGASALGFALFENVAYVAENGIGIGIFRAFSAMPLHIFTGVILGYYVGMARFTEDLSASKRLVWKGFAIAYVLHGLYDTFALSGSGIVLLLLPLIAGIVVFGVIVLNKGRKLSLARWLGLPPRTARLPPQGLPPVAAQEIAAAAHPGEPPLSQSPAGRRAPLWMAVISRVLLSLCAVFWLLLAIGLISPEADPGTSEAILGGVLLTFLPGGLGIILETGYRQRKRRLNTPSAPERIDPRAAV